MVYLFTYTATAVCVYIYIYGSVLVNEMPKSARYHIDRANSIFFTSKRLPLQPVSSEGNLRIYSRCQKGCHVQIYINT